MREGIRPRNNRPGFTLIELLVVIGIIVILMSILLPVVSAMRRRAQVTDTTAEITRIAVAIQNYYQDFRSYPGPVPESQLWGYNNNAVTVNATNLTGLPAPQLTSTENLVLGLCGGLQAPTSAASTAVSYNVNLIKMGPQNLNYMNPQQFPPYYDASPAELANNGAGMLTSWTKTQGPNYASPALGTPELLDHFSNPHPIIYLRAVVGGTSICDGTNSQYYTSEVNLYWHIYPAYNNQSSFGYAGQGKALSTPDASGNILYPSPTSFFQSPTINDGLTPRSKDSFILISPGPDGIYGNIDDIIYSN